MTILVLVASAILLSAMSDGANPRPIQSSMTFYYDPPSQYFLMETTSKCYITALTRAEKDHIHSHQGIEDLELTFVREWLGALNETLIYHTDPNLPLTFQSKCHDRDIFYLNRVLQSSGTVPSIIG